MSEEKKPLEGSPLPPPTSDGLKEWLVPVQDPELFMSLVELGLIYSVKLESGIADVEMTLTSPGCPAADHLVNEVKKRLLEYPGITAANVAVVFEPKWDPKTMASDEVKDRLGIW